MLTLCANLTGIVPAANGTASAPVRRGVSSARRFFLGHRTHRVARDPCVTARTASRTTPASPHAQPCLRPSSLARRHAPPRAHQTEAHARRPSRASTRSSRPSART
eukprot:4129127-Prymnesium_polylepis.2